MSSRHPDPRHAILTQSGRACRVTALVLTVLTLVLWALGLMDPIDWVRNATAVAGLVLIGLACTSLGRRLITS